MNRRDLLRSLSTAIALPAISGLGTDQLLGVGRRAHARARAGGLQVLDPHQSATVATIADMIIPPTDTPGARAAEVHRFVDLLLAEWAPDDDRKQFLEGLADVDARARAVSATDFLSATEAQRSAILTALDAGRPIDPARDYVEHVPPWQMKFRGFGDRKALEHDQFIQRHCYACNEYSGKFFVNDRENPYTFDSDKPFHWIRGRQVGGKSIMWGRQVYRWSDLDFEANARDGFGVDWP